MAKTSPQPPPGVCLITGRFQPPASEAGESPARPSQLECVWNSVEPEAGRDWMATSSSSCSLTKVSFRAGWRAQHVRGLCGRVRAASPPHPCCIIAHSLNPCEGQFTARTLFAECKQHTGRAGWSLSVCPHHVSQPSREVCRWETGVLSGFVLSLDKK